MATAATVFRNYETDGVPSSGNHKPKKGDIRTLLTGYEVSLTLISANPGLIFPDKATMDSILTYGQGQMAWVLGDATVANNGIYRKVGASGLGSWVRLGDLPYGFIKATDAGAGTANAIQATTTLPVTESAIVWLNIFEANTASPVTVSFNGGSVLTIKTNSGNDVAAGGLTSGMLVLGVVSGSTFRLVSDQASAAILAAAEAAQAAAEAAAASVNIRNVATRTALKAVNTAVATLAFLGEAGREGMFEWTTGDYSTHIAADTAEGVYIKADAIAATAGAWIRVYDELDVRWFGAVGDGSNATTAFAAAIALSQFLDLDRVVCRDPSKRFKIIELQITAKIEIDLCGGTILGDFGAWGTSSIDATPIYWTKNVFYSVAANAPSVTLKNLTLDGQNDPSLQMLGGTPMVDFRGAASASSTRNRCKIVLDNVVMTKGSNRIYTTGSGISAPAAFLDYRNCEMLIYNADEVWITNTSLRSSPGEMLQIQSDDARTKVYIDGFYATKERDQSTSVWSSSALNLFNCHPCSEIRRSRFYNFVKGPINVATDGLLVDSCVFDTVTDSNGLDLNEAGLIRQNKFVVRNCYFKDIVNAGIRASASNTLFENNTFLRVARPVRYEANVSGTSALGSWVKVTDVPLYNNVVRNTHVEAFSASHTGHMVVEVLGVSASIPIYVTVDGIYGVDFASASNLKGLYGVWAENAHVVVKGYISAGKTALVHLEGTSSLHAIDAIFEPEEAETVSVIEFTNATLGARSVIVDNCRRLGNLAASRYDFGVGSGNTIDINAIHVNNSPNFAGFTNSAIVHRDGWVSNSATYNPPSLADGAGDTATITVSGARVGDLAVASFNVNTQGIIMSAWVNASDQVSVRFQNETGGVLDIASGTLTCYARTP